MFSVDLKPATYENDGSAPATAASATATAERKRRTTADTPTGGASSKEPKPTATACVSTSTPALLKTSNAFFDYFRLVISFEVIDFFCIMCEAIVRN